MSVSINMSRIPHSDPAPAGAHSPNSDEEIEVEVDSDNTHRIQESFLVKLNWTLHEKMGLIMESLTILILIFILIGFLYNHFSKDERHFPIHFFIIYINC